MKKNVNFVICLFFLLHTFGSALAGEHYKGKDPPSLDIIQKNIEMLDVSYVKEHSIKVVGIHKERDGAYLVIISKDYELSSSRFELLRLESGEWIMEDILAHLRSRSRRVFLLK